jgi:hypothetical protein
MDPEISIEITPLPNNKKNIITEFVEFFDELYDLTFLKSYFEIAKKNK